MLCCSKNNQDKNVAFFSLEMPKKSVAMRIYSAALNISNEHFKFNMLTADELSKISEFTEKFSSETSNFYIEDDMNMSIYDIQSSCRNIKNKSNKDFALIAIDYLQIIKIASNGNRAMDLGEVSRICVLMSKEFDCPVILLSQVNRSCEAKNKIKDRCYRTLKSLAI
ncbi:MAG: DnaB-like helicase C-terminal domain-containing protein [Lachnospirales bacterium]